jgi:hypothetical protein
VNVQVFRLLPPLEQAPDQIASRPSEADNVIDVPVLNDAEPEPPTATLIPVGLDVMRWPLRPDAVTVKVADPAGGVVPCGVNRRAAENGPKTPAEFRARTRHHSACAGIPAASVACDAVVVGLATSGADIAELSSTCTS